MSLTHAILAALSSEPRTGYDLAKSFQGSIGFFWKASHQQIYRELERIHQSHWSKLAIETQDGKPDRKVYTLTEAGYAELRRWIEEPTEKGPAREPLLVKLFAGHVTDEKKLSLRLREQLELHQVKLKEYLEVEKLNFRSRKSMSKAARYQHFTLKYGIQYEKGWIAWCKGVLKELNDAARVAD